MRRETFDGGWYATAKPSGAFAVIRHADADIHTHRGTLNAGERMLFPDSWDRQGFRLAGATHSDPPRVLEYRDGQWYLRAEHPSGTSPVIYRPDGSLLVNEPGSSVGSQGFRYIAANGEVYTGDATYGPMDGILLHEWTDFPGVGRFGQGPDDNGFWLYDYATGLYHELITGKARFGRVSGDSGMFAIACWVEPHRAEILWATMGEMRMGFPGKVTPKLDRPEPPPVEPPVPPVEPPTPPSEPETPEVPPAPPVEPPAPAEPEQRTERRMYGNQEVWLTPSAAAAIDKLRGGQ